jgi:hypothetical protein
MRLFLARRQVTEESFGRAYQKFGLWGLRRVVSLLV